MKLSIFSSVSPQSGVCRTGHGQQYSARSLAARTMHSAKAVTEKYGHLPNTVVLLEMATIPSQHSTIFPSLAKTPATLKGSLKILNKSMIISFSISCSRSNQNVLLSSTLSFFQSQKTF